MDIVYPHFVDEAYEVKHNPSHRWFYKKGMTQDDAVVFKLFDSLRSEATGESSPCCVIRMFAHLCSVSSFCVHRPVSAVGHAEACQHRGQGHRPWIVKLVTGEMQRPIRSPAVTFLTYFVSFLTPPR